MAKGSINQPPQIRGKGGRPKRVFTDVEEQQIEQYARINCHDRTISTALRIPINTLIRRFGTKIKVWRALGKLELREDLYKQVKTSPQTAIFVAKNELGMVDKQVIVDESKQRELDEVQKAACKDIAAAVLHIRPLEAKEAG